MDGSQQEFPVLDADVPVGVLTRSDLLRGLQRLGPGARVQDAMTANGDVADPMEPLEDAFRRMREHHLSGLPVVQAGSISHVLGARIAESVWQGLASSASTAEALRKPSTAAGMPQ